MNFQRQGTRFRIIILSIWTAMAAWNTQDSRRMHNPRGPSSRGTLNLTDLDDFTSRAKPTRALLQKLSLTVNYPDSFILPGDIKISEMEFKCSKCEKYFCAKSRLNRHMVQVHKVPKEVKYDIIIIFHFTVLFSNITIHVNLHYMIQWTFSSFIHIWNLRATFLQEVHPQKVKPFKCCHCERSYVWNKHLKSHMKASHSNIPVPPKYKCDVCEKGFSRKNLFMFHKKEHLVSCAWVFVHSK